MIKIVVLTESIVGPIPTNDVARPNIVWSSESEFV